MEKMKPEQVVAMLNEKGMIVTIEQAILILEFLRMLAQLVVSDYLVSVKRTNEKCKLRKNL